MTGKKPVAEDRSEAMARAYELMRAHYGHQHWWPGETPFEVCVGAILTQNTNWGNVERAIARLKAAGVLEPHRLHALPVERLAELIRPAGYFNVKARRLRAFLVELVERHGGELKALFGGSTAIARRRLLEIQGVGPETADSMLLYAGHHTSFVIDAYTRRIFARHGWCDAGTDYEGLQALCQETLVRTDARERLDYWQDYHAQLVNVAKDYCRKSQPRCEGCPLRPLLPGPLNGPGASPRPAECSG